MNCYKYEQKFLGQGIVKNKYLLFALLHFHSTVRGYGQMFINNFSTKACIVCLVAVVIFLLQVKYVIVCILLKFHTEVNLTMYDLSMLLQIKLMKMLMDINAIRTKHFLTN